MSSGCVKTAIVKVQAPRPASGAAEPLEMPVVIAPVTDAYEQGSATSPYRANPAFLGKIMADMIALGPVPLIPLDVSFREYRAEPTRAKLMAEVMAARLRARGIAARDGALTGLAEGELAFSMGLRSVQVTAKHGFITLIIDSGLIFKGISPTVSMFCKLWSGGKAEPVWSGEVKHSLPEGTNGYGAEAFLRVMSNAAEECVEKSGVAGLHANAVSKKVAELLQRGDYTQAYRLAVSPEQSASAIQGLARTAGTREIPEEARNMMARGKAATSMAKNPAEFETASAAMERAVAIAPWWASGHYNAALAAEGAGRWTAGAKHLKLYLQLKPDADDLEAVRMKIAELELHQERADKPAGAQ